MVQLAWNKLYRRAIFTQLRYPEGKLNEDLFLIPEVCLQIQKAVVVPKVLYYYVQRSGSIMGKTKRCATTMLPRQHSSTGTVLWKTRRMRRWQMQHSMSWAV